MESEKDPEITTKYFSLPYVNEKSERIVNKLSNLVKETFTKTNGIQRTYLRKKSIWDCFRFKDQVYDPKSHSNVVYKIKFENCEASYIGYWNLRGKNF